MNPTLKHHKELIHLVKRMIPLPEIYQKNDCKDIKTQYYYDPIFPRILEHQHKDNEDTLSLCCANNTAYIF